MRINRRGSERRQGTSYIELKDPTIRWDSNDRCLKVSCRRVQDFSTPANHDYTISLTLDECSRLLDTLGDAATSEAGALSSALAPSLRALIRLTLACVGPVGTAATSGSPPTK